MEMVLIIRLVITLVIFLLALLVLKLGYIKAPPNEAYLISGLRKKTVIGKSSVRIPGLERVDKLYLGLITVDVKTGTYVPTNEFVNVKVDSVVTLKIGNQVDMLNLAGQNFLNYKPDEIVDKITDVLEGNIREIIGQMELKDMIQDRKEFAKKVQDNVVPDLASMGLELITFNVQSFEDENGIIKDLGIENVEQIKKEASIAKAKAERDVKIEAAKASQESTHAEVESDKANTKQLTELAKLRAEMKIEEDTIRAKADIAYKIQEEENRKLVEEKIADANLMKSERDIEIEKNKLDSSKKNQADVENYERRQKADAEKYEIEKRAEGIRKMGEAEAYAIRLKAVAEAEGIDKKAEAMKKYGQAAIMEMYFDMLPEMAKNIAEPMSAIDKISIIGGSSTDLSRNVMHTMTQIEESLGETMGFNIKDVLSSFLNKSSLNNNDLTDGGDLAMEDVTS